MSVPVRIKEEVWRRHNGDKTEGTCFVCNILITSFSFVAGHIQPRSQGGPDTVENLRPICSSCNNSMGTQNLLDYKLKHFSAGSSRLHPESPKEIEAKLIIEEKKRREELRKQLVTKIEKLREEEKELVSQLKELESSFCEMDIDGKTDDCETTDVDDKTRRSKKMDSPKIEEKIKAEKKKSLKEYLSDFVREYETKDGVYIKSTDAQSLALEYLKTNGQEYSSGHFTKTFNDVFNEKKRYLWCLDKKCKQKSCTWCVSFGEVRVDQKRLPEGMHIYNKIYTEEAHQAILDAKGKK